MARVLVIGGGSFVGRHLLARLGEQGHVLLATRRAAGPKTEQGVEWAECDLAKPGAIEPLVARFLPEAVVNLSGATATTDPRAQYALHVLGTLDLLQSIARHAPGAAVVLLGSAAEYGNVSPEMLPVTEATPAQPTSFFGASKLAQTQLAASAAAELRLRVTTLRPFNVIGPGLPEQYMAAAFIKRLRASMAAGDRAPLQVANAAATRDFVDVRDVARAIESTLDRPPAAGEALVFNVASGSEVTILEVAEHLGRLAGGIAAVDAGDADSRSRVTRSRGDASRLRDTTGWRPTFDWRASLDDLWAEAERGVVSPTC